MVLQKYKIYVTLDLVFTILGPFLQAINIDRLISITYYNFQITILI